MAHDFLNRTHVLCLLSPSVCLPWSLAGPLGPPASVKSPPGRLGDLFQDQDFRPTFGTDGMAAQHDDAVT
ncbi:hypothetical protein NKDENANG_00378 [Candidatus Entotheonellaceae bacterium PAL068K]